ncbi:ROK family protein [Niallia circulans]|uniref:ROK family transcriptional regulator n=1 Tax=Niallia circulans TaxID=1397 RepID=UPI000BA56F88|nr:ROK family transcriptional regulator [Niallia circulans]PAD26367.1 ROK family protein [Niallia circulans]PAD86820.1 ROK family protein [Niallia circulans]PAE10766.1 ROK family protein [Niallia circulans]
MHITWNQQLVKKENKSLCLNLIKNTAPISRADIAQQTGLTKGTVSSLVSELINEQLIYESGHGESNGGRRPVMLLFNEMAGYSIGIDLGVNYILGILTDLQGNIIYRINEKYENSSYEDTLRTIKKIITTLINAAPKSVYGVIGIGIGVPGITNMDGDILLAPNLGWNNVSLKSQLEEEFHLPVLVENEANTGAYGEKKFGVGQPYQNLIYVSAAIGIGAGIIINGELYKGALGYSGEIGHMTIQKDGLECRCGNKGCWELYASEQYLLNKAVELKLSINGQVYLNDLIELADQGNTQAIHLFNEVGYHLGAGIINIIHIFNPEQIIIGNRLTLAKKWIEPQVKKIINNYTLPFHHSQLAIQFSDINFASSALGAAAFSTENFLKFMLHPE